MELVYGIIKGKGVSVDMAIDITGLSYEELKHSNSIKKVNIISNRPDIYYVDISTDLVKTGFDIYSSGTEEIWGNGLMDGYVQRYEDIFDMPKPYLKEALRNKVLSTEGKWIDDEFYYSNSEINKIFI